MTLAVFKAWAEDAAIRAVKTFAQTLVALMGAASVNVLSLPWGDYLGIAATAAVASVAHNLAALPGAAASTADNKEA